MRRSQSGSVRLKVRTRSHLRTLHCLSGSPKENRKREVYDCGGLEELGRETKSKWKCAVENSWASALVNKTAYQEDRGKMRSSEVSSGVR